MSYKMYALLLETCLNMHSHINIIIIHYDMCNVIRLYYVILTLSHPRPPWYSLLSLPFEQGFPLIESHRNPHSFRILVFGFRVALPEELQKLHSYRILGFLLGAFVAPRRLHLLPILRYIEGVSPSVQLYGI